MSNKIQRVVCSLKNKRTDWIFSLAIKIRRMSERVSLHRIVVMNCTHGQVYNEYGRVEKRSTAHSKLK